MFSRLICLVTVLIFGCCLNGAAKATAQSPNEITNSIGMKLVLIPKGTFLMGSPPSEEGSKEDEWQHEVTLSQDYYLGVFEVTQSQYQKVMGKNPSRFQGKEVEQKVPAKRHPQTGRVIEEEKTIAVDTQNHPVERVSWHDAIEFCKRLSELPAEKSAGRVYRLPTEAEWEYACRSGSKTAYNFGENSTSLSDYGWYSVRKDATHSVGSKKPNAWGVYDMHGNVMEWCNDDYGMYPKEAVIDPIGPKPKEHGPRVIRGGCWSRGAADCRSAARFEEDSLDDYGDDLGFRIALSLPSLTPE